MNIKDNANYVKNELSGDEKLLESVLKFETFYNKHKIKIFVVIAAIALFFISTAALEVWQKRKNEKANEALLKLAANPADKDALAALQENNQPLYELYSYQKASQAKDIKKLQELSKSENKLVADLSAYEAGALSQKPKDSVYYQDMATIQKAYVAINNKDIATAKKLLDTIGEESPLASVARLYKHYTISNVSRQ